MCPRERPRGQGRPQGLHLCLLYFPQLTTFDLFLPINSEQFTSGRG